MVNRLSVGDYRELTCERQGLLFNDSSKPKNEPNPKSVVAAQANDHHGQKEGPKEKYVMPFRILPCSAMVAERRHVTAVLAAFDAN
jgi:hypothetical protein